MTCFIIFTPHHLVGQEYSKFFSASTLRDFTETVLSRGIRKTSSETGNLTFFKKSLLGTMSNSNGPFSSISIISSRERRQPGWTHSGGSLQVAKAGRCARKHFSNNPWEHWSSTFAPRPRVPVWGKVLPRPYHFSTLCSVKKAISWNNKVY